MSKPIRVYADTSVYGGAFDPEFEKPSRLFFEQVWQGRFTLLASPLVEDELLGAPDAVRAHYESLVDILVPIPVSSEAEALQAAYLKAGIVSERSAEDALHVALSTVHGCGLLVSWNFRHIVHIEKGPRYNAVNTLHGYPAVDIHSPAEVVRYGEDI